jgi:hypothetical protein
VPRPSPLRSTRQKTASRPPDSFSHPLSPVPAAHHPTRRDPVPDLKPAALRRARLFARRRRASGNASTGEIDEDAPHQPRRHDERRELLERRFVPRTPGHKQLGHLRRRRPPVWAVLVVRNDENSMPVLARLSRPYSQRGPRQGRKRCAPRVDSVASAFRTDKAVILGTAIAHELGHLLLPANAHSPAGIMPRRVERHGLRSRHTGHPAVPVARDPADSRQIGRPVTGARGLNRSAPAPHLP